VLGACSSQKTAQSATPTQKPTAAAAAAPTTPTVTGTVVETMEAASYTYVKVDTGKEQVWAAASHFDVKVGDRVVVPLEMAMENFHSQTLKRDFPLIYFVSAITREGEQGQPAMPPGHPPLGGAAPSQGAPPVVKAIAPPAGGLSVAKVWADREALAGKSVLVRGQVTKFNSGILGRNWVHIQDGSGAASDGSNDLTITTLATVAVGDVITVKGTVAVKQDFGAGYTYAVVVQDASVEGK
jgi:hypothetical protein